MRAKMKKSKQENDVENQVNVGICQKPPFYLLIFFLEGGGGVQCYQVTDDV